jgi:hypothetical protein
MTRCRENAILSFMVTSLINGKVERVPWFKTWCEPIWFCIRLNPSIGMTFVAKMRFWPIWLQVWWIWRLNLSFDVLWCETWYLVLIFGFKFGKLKVMRWPLSRKRDFSLYGYKFDKYECWPCPSISFDAKHDMWTYLVSYSVKWKYWNDPCRENEFLVYMLTSLINGKFELVPWCPWMQTWYVNLFGFVFGKMKVLEWPLSRKWDFGLYAYKFDKWEVWTCPLMSLDANVICEPIWFCIR